MRYSAGIDVSLEESRVCVVAGEGRLVREAKVPSEPEALVAFLGSRIVTTQSDDPGRGCR